jgi:hypothetical protein
LQYCMQAALHRKEYSPRVSEKADDFVFIVSISLLLPPRIFF